MAAVVLQLRGTVRVHRSPCVRSGSGGDHPAGGINISKAFRVALAHLELRLERVGLVEEGPPLHHGELRVHRRRCALWKVALSAWPCGVCSVQSLKTVFSTLEKALRVAALARRRYADSGQV